MSIEEHSSRLVKAIEHADANGISRHLVIEMALGLFKESVLAEHDLNKNKLKPKFEKHFSIESQSLDGILDARKMYDMIKLADEAGYSHVRDYWAHNSYDTYTMKEALVRFTPENYQQSGVDFTPKTTIWK